MAELQVPDDVSKVTMGGSTIWQNSDGWVPLRLPDGVSGNVLFKDIGNGNAYLNGQIELSGLADRGTYTMLLPPDGYKFVSVSWHASYAQPSANGIACYPILGSSMIVGSNDMFADVSCVDGNLKAHFYSVLNQSGFSGHGVIYFSQRMTTAQRAGRTTPAVVGIERV